MLHWCVPCAGVGLSNFQYANMASMRNIFIIGFALYNGLSISRYFEAYTESEGHGPVNTSNQEFNGVTASSVLTPLMSSWLARHGAKLKVGCSRCRRLTNYNVKNAEPQNVSHCVMCH